MRNWRTVTVFGQVSLEASALTHASRLGLLGRRSPLLRLQGDERLIALIRDGQERAFEALFERYQSRLLAFCRGMLASAEDAEDVLQEVFVAAHKAILADNRAINARPWLYRIARNRCLNHLRKPVPEGQDSMDVHASQNGASVAEHVQKREELRALIADVHDLPETQRTALLLREIDALAYEEIAVAMETTVPAVKSLLVRARMSLADCSQARQLTCDEVHLELAEAAEGLRKASGPARAHMRECDRCREYRSELRRNGKALAALAPIGPLAALHAALPASSGWAAPRWAREREPGSGASAGASAGGAAATTAAGTSTAAVGGAAAAGGGGLSLAGGAAAGGIGGALGTKAAASVASMALLTAGAVEVKDYYQGPESQRSAADRARGDDGDGRPRDARGGSSAGRPSRPGRRGGSGRGAAGGAGRACRPRVAGGGARSPPRSRPTAWPVAPTPAPAYSDDGGGGLSHDPDPADPPFDPGIGRSAGPAARAAADGPTADGPAPSRAAGRSAAGASGHLIPGQPAGASGRVARARVPAPGCDCDLELAANGLDTLDHRGQPDVPRGKRFAWPAAVHPAPVVGHLQHYDAAGGREPHADRAGAGVMNRVGEQLAHEGQHELVVAAERLGREVHLDRKAALPLGLPRDRADGLLQPAALERHRMQGEQRLAEVRDRGADHLVRPGHARPPRRRLDQLLVGREQALQGVVVDQLGDAPPGADPRRPSPERRTACGQPARPAPRRARPRSSAISARSSASLIRASRGACPPQPLRRGPRRQASRRACGGASSPSSG